MEKRSLRSITLFKGPNTPRKNSKSLLLLLSLPILTIVFLSLILQTTDTIAHLIKLTCLSEKPEATVAAIKLKYLHHN